MASDIEQIQNLIARMAFLTDTGTAEQMAALFWDECETRFDTKTHTGIEAVTRGFARWIEKMRAPVVGLRHAVYTPLIEVDGDRATAQAYYDADGHSKNRGKLIQLRGLYKDTFEKRNGEWRFLSRETQIWRSLLDHADTKKAGD